MVLSVLVVGHGSIAAWVADHVKDDQNLRIDYVLCRPGREDAARAAIPGAEAISDVSQLDNDVVDGDVDYALECAGHGGLAAHGPGLLERGIDLGVISIGAFSDPDISSALEQAAKASEAQIELLGGAIGAIDALAAARQGGLEEVTYIGRKPPAGWKGSAAENVLDLDGLNDAEVHFTGSAREAAQAYPKNANVAATVALAGLGLDHTKVTLVADPAMTGNRHVVEAKGAFGSFSFTIDGKALPGNPKSSALTAMSAVRALRNRAALIRI
ncbi:MAG: aspartate dehydrogenase [Alphaproteobacteria bacterium]|jgi:aspartate dehydrogenase|nr:aspartate dehydrogenase [Alphaproteobacteria bacterium]MBT4018780.1 aspartate dehydrogenase [Alphaproteobacteria bacterium]MBT4966369.1 aspartate dehydrogenase [Alphaproteobacteria bacterium]MBT5160181.1 aspartate dehydrogenase [Alphaproteobacteria bacterium]MBT6385468.1 aspartate dehydrogenase [Alphaproteobacteria bacterium]